MDASIIIPLYRRVGWIGKCVEKLAGQDFGGSFEVVIVDDGSPNEPEIGDAVKGLSAREKPVIRYLRNRHSGPAATRNYGVRASAGRIICFLDDDSLPDKGWLGEVMGSFSDPDAAVVSGKTLSYDRAAPLPLLLEKAVYDGKSWATCNIAYRRDVFDRLGGFDEAFPEPSWEDNDLGIRARWAGHKHVYNEKAIVYHPHEVTIEEYKRKCLLNGRGAAVFSRKYLLRKPAWGIGTPFAMARRLVYGLLPSTWSRTLNGNYLKFLWSFYSLKGFMGAKGDAAKN